MGKWTVSIRSFFILCLLLMFAGLYVFERTRADRLQGRLEAVASPIRLEIEALRLDVLKRELAYKYALTSFESDREFLDLNFSDPGNIAAPKGLRRELANLRNSKLKIDRAKQKLIGMEKEFAELTGLSLEPR